MYCRRVAHVPNPGYTPEILEAREEILRGALETLASSGSKRDYDDRLQIDEIYEVIPDEYFASTLALIQESGDYDTVITAGETWLSQHKQHKNAADVALAVGLAFCDRARHLLDSHGNVDNAVTTLLKASNILESHRRKGMKSVESLYQRIGTAISDLQPALVVELLESDDNKSYARAMELVPKVILSFEDRIQDQDRAEFIGDNGLGSRAAAAQGDLSRQQFFSKLRKIISAEDHVKIFKLVPNAYATSPSELYTAAMAHISAGAANGSVDLIERAAELLKDAEKQSNDRKLSEEINRRSNLVHNARVLEERQRIAVASSVAALLLGDSTAAGEALGLHDGRIKCDRQVMAFIKENSDRNSPSLLPGVCSLVESWINDVAMVTYKPQGMELSSNAKHFDLNSWFDDPKVIEKLEYKLHGKHSGILGVLQSIAAVAYNFFSSSDSERMETKKIESENGKPVSEDKKNVPASKSPQEIGKEESSNMNKRNIIESTPLKSSELTESLEVVATKDSLEKTESSAIPIEQQLQTSSGKSNIFDEKSESIEEYISFEEKKEDFLETPVALEAIHPLRGEDAWMRSAYETRRILWGRVFGATIFTIAGAIVLARSILPPQYLSFVGNLKSKIKTSEKSNLPVGKPGAVLSKSQASSLVDKWQRIKAEALGPNHNLEKLEDILSGALLHQWKTRALDLQKKDWYYEHNLKSIAIDSVKQGNTPGIATVQATFKEGLAVHKPNKPDTDTFMSDYSVQYTAVHLGKDRWVFTEAKVQAAN